MEQSTYSPSGSTTTDCNAGFSSGQRMHISLNVTSLRNSLAFYRILFNTNPAKVRSGYAKFDMKEPPLNFTLNEHPEDTKTQGHFGIQVKSTMLVHQTHERLAHAAFKLITEENVECCYAEQTKVWAADPDGNRWEFFVTTDPDAEEGCGPACICHQEFERTYATI